MVASRKFITHAGFACICASIVLLTTIVIVVDLSSMMAASASDKKVADNAALKGNEKLVEEARREIDSSHWQTGITILSRAIRNDPQCEECLYWRAVAEVNSGKGSAAIADLSLLEKLQTKVYKPFLQPLKVGALYADGKFEEANRLADQLLKQGDKNAFLYYIKANLLKDQGHFEQALKLHERASDSKTASWRAAHAQLLFTCALDARCPFRQAKEYLKRTEILHPTEDYWIVFAGVLAKRGHRQEAIEVVRESDRFDSKLKMSVSKAEQKSRVLKDVGLLKEAVALIDGYRRRSPNNPSILMAEIEILSAAGLHEALVPLAKQLLRSGKCEPAPVRMFLSQALTHLNRTDEALAETQKEVRARPNSSAGYFMRADVLIARKEPDLALIDLNKAVELDPTRYEGRCARASLYMNLMQGEKAITDLDYAIKLEPKRGYAYSLRAACYRDYLLDLERAKADMRKSQGLPP